MSRDAAKRENLVFYNNGVPCAHNHTPIIRLTSTGICFHCVSERKANREKEVKERAVYKPTFYLRFKKRDGSVETIGPFRTRAVAVAHYKRRYRAEYDENCPSSFFDEL